MVHLQMAVNPIRHGVPMAVTYCGIPYSPKGYGKRCQQCVRVRNRREGGK